MKECIMKKLKELASSNFHKSIMNSPSSNHGFVCVACAKLRLEDIARREKGKCRLYFTKVGFRLLINNLLAIS